MHLITIISNFKYRLFQGNDSNYSRSYYYERLLNKFKSIDAYLELFARAKRRSKVITQTPIRFKPNVRLGKKYNNIKRHLPKLSHEVCNQENTKIKFYRIKIGGHKVKMEMHFYKSSLFYYSYSFSYLNDEDKLAIRSILAKKNKLPEGLNIECLSIHDEGGSMFYVEDNVDFVIHYLSKDSEFVDNVFQIKAKEIKKNKRKLISRTQDLYEKL